MYRFITHLKVCSCTKWTLAPSIVDCWMLGRHFCSLGVKIWYLQHRGRKWCSIPLDFRADLILKSAEMTEIERIPLVLLSIHINWEGETNILPISVISADLRINSARKSSGMEHHLRPMCFSNSYARRRLLLRKPCVCYANLHIGPLQFFTRLTTPWFFGVRIIYDSCRFLRNM